MSEVSVPYTLPLIVMVCLSGFCGVSIWDVETGGRVSIPGGFSSPDAMDASRIFSTSHWVYFATGDLHLLLLGGLDGALTAWRWNEATVVSSHPLSILPIDAEARHSRSSISPRMCPAPPPRK